MGEHIMTGAELASQLKGQLNNNMIFNGISGADDPSLHLSEEDIAWWQDAKLGLFIHWGVYSLLGKGEWVYFNEKIPEETYRKIAENDFHPFSSAKDIANEWIRLAKNAGMKYAVMVTRHHDGFAMWDSKCSWKNFTSAACGPKTDYVRAFTDACHENGLYTGLYYSPMDWRFPAYFDPKGLPENAALMKQQTYGQLRELCSNYGKIDILWYDGGWLAHQGTDSDSAWFWEPIRMNHMVRSLQPKIMVSPRSGYRGDFECDEGPHAAIGKIVPIPWEKCMTLSSLWGYIPNDCYHDEAFIIRMLADVVCRGGNLLLNIGPDPQGRFPEEAKKLLSSLGEWMRENGEAVYGTRAGYLQPKDNVYGSTHKGNSMYLHILDCRAFEQEILPIPDEAIIHASVLDGTPVSVLHEEGGIKISLPKSVKEKQLTDTIVRLTVKDSFCKQIQ